MNSTQVERIAIACTILGASNFDMAIDVAGLAHSG